MGEIHAQRKIAFVLLVVLIAALLVTWLVQRSSPVLTVGIFLLVKVNGKRRRITQEAMLSAVR